MISPGIRAPAKSPRMPTPNCWANRINTRLGGSIWARVPEAMITPVDNLLS